MQLHFTSSIDRSGIKLVREAIELEDLGLARSGDKLPPKSKSSNGVHDTDGDPTYVDPS